MPRIAPAALLAGVLLAVAAPGAAHAAPRALVLDMQLERASGDWATLVTTTRDTTHRGRGWIVTRRIDVRIRRSCEALEARLPARTLQHVGVTLALSALDIRATGAGCTAGRDRPLRLLRAAAELPGQALLADGATTTAAAPPACTLLDLEIDALRQSSSRVRTRIRATGTRRMAVALTATPGTGPLGDLLCRRNTGATPL